MIESLFSIGVIDWWSLLNTVEPVLRSTLPPIIPPELFSALL